MSARKMLLQAIGIRGGWMNHSATVIRGGLSANHSATLVKASR